jgi:preprotein translocase subunit YajC
MSTPFLITASAWAQGAGAQQPPPGGPIVQFLLGPVGMMIIIVSIIYLLIMRPQQKKQKQHQEMLRNLQKGDRVVTQAGIYGIVAQLDEKTVLLQVADKVQVRVARWAVADKVTENVGI